MSHSALVRLRRFFQAFFLALFLFLLVKTEFRGELTAVRGDVRLPYPISIFLEADPLVGLSNALATGALYRGLLWCLVILIPTLFLGRFFCGWICPLGTLHHVASNLRSEKKRGRRLIDSNRYKRWQNLKYYVLIALLAAALCGSVLATLLDPLSLTVRSLALSLLPALNYVLDALSGRSLLSFKQPHFRQAVFLGLIFGAFVVFNLRITRFWCRALCPLGALLGAVSRWSILGLEKHPSHCEDCNRCLLHCQGGDDPIPGAPWRKAECHLCLNCLADCPESGIRFKFFPSSAEVVPGPNLERRKALAGLGAGLVALPVLRGGTGFAAERNDRLVRPPGALDEKNFLARCIRCGECMKVCPNNALHPALVQAGLEGIWTPLLAARIGYCEPSCVLCGQACPTGAIWEFTSWEKGWVSGDKPIRIGTAFYDHGRCLPWSMATECIVCEEWCPTSPKAVYLRPAQVVDGEGKVKTVRQPYVDPQRCVGCGACEFACPVVDRPAIYVTSIGESRSRSNQFLLARPKKEAAGSIFPETGEVAGWAKGGEPRTFTADNLWQYIDGDAEKYIQAGVRKTLAADYKYRSKVDAAADIYVMATPDGARRIFESEPAEGSRPIQTGDGGRLYGASLTFRRGPYFVRLVAYEETEDIGRGLVDLAKAIDGRLR